MNLQYLILEFNVYHYLETILEHSLVENILCKR